MQTESSRHLQIFKMRDWEGVLLALMIALASATIFFSPPSSALLQATLFASGGLIILYLLWRVILANQLTRRLEDHNFCLLELAKSETIVSGNPVQAARVICSASANTLQADRSSIWTFNEDYSEAECLCVYNRKSNEFYSGHRISRSDFPLVFENLLQGKIVSYDDCRVVPELMSQLEKAAEAPVTSLLHANVQRKGELKAVISFSHAGKQRQWHPEERNFAASIADLFSICLGSAREKTIDEELHLKSLAIDTALDGIGILDHKGRFTFVNKALAEIFGFSSEQELVNRPWRSLYAEQELKRFDDYILPRFFREKELLVETIGRKKDGTLFPQELTMKSLEHHGWIVAARDISKRKRVERNAEQVALFATLNPSPVIRFGIDGKVLIANPAAIDLLDIRGERIENLEKIIPEIRDTDINEVIRSGRIETISTMIGERTYRLVLKGIPYLQAGHLYAFDVSDLRLKEEQVRRNQHLLQDVVNSNPNLIFLKDSAGVFKLINQSAADLFGSTIEELIGRRDVEFVEDPAARERMRSEDNIVLNEERDISILEDGYTDQEGNTRWLQTVKRPILIDGEVHILGVATDVTEQKELREQLVRSSRLEALGQLAGGIAHDFNNLLTGIFGYTNLLKLLRGHDAQVSEAAEMIEVAAKRASQLTEKLLGFARKGKNRSIVIDAHKALDEVYSLIRRTFERNLTIEVNYGASAPYIMGDPTQMNQVFLNLVINARDSMSKEKGGTDGGHLTISTRALSRAEASFLENSIQESPRVLEVSVRDTGCGIPKTIQERIFEPFFTTKAEGKGTGMGLAMVYGIVRNHGGTIRVSSEPGVGTNFRVYLPLQDSLREEAPDTSKAWSEREKVERGSGLILLVDDHNIVRDVGAKMLSTLGYEVITARDGVEALELYKRNGTKIDLVILDMIMPRMGALECYQGLKEFDPNVRALLSSGYVNNQSVDTILAEGVLGFVQKPYRLRELSKAVQKALGKSDESLQGTSRGPSRSPATH